jgi:hypothetical protein
VRLRLSRRSQRLSVVYVFAVDGVEDSRHDVYVTGPGPVFDSIGPDTTPTAYRRVQELWAQGIVPTLYALPEETLHALDAGEWTLGDPEGGPYSVLTPPPGWSPPA